MAIVGLSSLTHIILL